ncbi:DUF4834 family protein [Psychroflexus maritimus]|uniref:DUF4834 family protein n=1 Tax=Psychroflexus maritimus TaxID=2714865 RepID=A0A967DYN6_9FLAO|nr:DUF4834 family protein [Psychroflexus maritimus]NGZ89313.1 DUF4834 family protein [Psychroflexus maritimus]
MDEFLKYFLYFLLFYFFIRIIAKWLWPILLKLMATKFRNSLEKRFNQEFQNRYRDHFNKSTNTSPSQKNDTKLKTKKNHQVGEYIDYEEID